MVSQPIRFYVTIDEGDRPRIAASGGLAHRADDSDVCAELEHTINRYLDERLAKIGLEPAGHENCSVACATTDGEIFTLTVVVCDEDRRAVAADHHAAPGALADDNLMLICLREAVDYRLECLMNTY